jgi:hypothetical protein
MPCEKEKQSGWSSLEAAKLLVPIVASVVLVYVGQKISEQVENFKSGLETAGKQADGLVARRLVIYDDVGRKLNRMFAYYMYIGRWKELSPEDIIKDKRELDEIIFTYEPFLSTEFVDIYKDLEAQMFKPYQGWGKDALLRTEVTRRQEFYLPYEKEKKAWDPGWSERFTGEDNTAAIRAAYSKLISALPEELGIPKFSKTPTRSIPIDQLAEPKLPPKNGS